MGEGEGKRKGKERGSSTRISSSFLAEDATTRELSFPFAKKSSPRRFVADGEATRRRSEGRCEQRKSLTENERGGRIETMGRCENESTDSTAKGVRKLGGSEDGKDGRRTEEGQGRKSDRHRRERSRAFTFVLVLLDAVTTPPSCVTPSIPFPHSPPDGGDGDDASTNDASHRTVETASATERIRWPIRRIPGREIWRNRPRSIRGICKLANWPPGV